MERCIVLCPTRTLPKAAKENGTTRAVASMEKASKLEKDVIFAVGNAPTALIELDKLIKNGQINPIAIIGVPVGFVNVVQAKELIMTSGVPYIVARGRKRRLKCGRRNL